ncbi:MAG: TonB-dependent receptor [Cytophagales bacterium]|nr:MAG: TonB-dependent receptor [Cytophagales bacterium]
MKNSTYYLILFFTFIFNSFAQDKTSFAILNGTIKDKSTNEPLIGATIQLIGTYKATVTDIEGKFEIKDIKPGDYNIKISYIGYADKIYNGIKLSLGLSKELNVDMVEVGNALGEVLIEGEKTLVDLEDGKSKFKITSEDIKEMSVRDVQQIVALQPGINQTPDGIQIRGSRAYETSYYVDGISAQDPLAGTGFGVGVNANSIQQLDVITGGAGAEYGDAVAGVISAKIREGGDKWRATGNWTTDNQTRLWNSSSMGWNTDNVNFGVGGPILKKKLTFFSSIDMNLTDEYTSVPNEPCVSGQPCLTKESRFKATQLVSSLYDDRENGNTSFSKIFAPRQDNRWANTVKLAYNIGNGMKLTLTNQTSLAINQNTRSLQVIGFDQIFSPGFQYRFSRNLDNATTYTNQTNLTSLNFKHFFGKKWNYDLTLGRMFSGLRADANGRPFRPQTIDQVYDAESIISDPVTVYNSPNPDIKYVNPGPGYVNNNGISSVWHDHYVEEITLRGKLVRTSENKKSVLSMGFEHVEQEFQWADVDKPWVGAPIKINDELTTPSTSVGSRSDIWKVNPCKGGLFINEDLKYKGIIASFGLRMDYWAFGKYVDDAVKDPRSPISSLDRTDYENRTVDLGRRFQARLLPSLNVSFPITDNNVMYFNYSHAKRLEHPRYYYQALNPEFQSRGFLSEVGNPALKPQTTVAYELGYKSQITQNTAIELKAFYKDIFDYVTKRVATIQDRTGQFVDRELYINQDYARIRGIEFVYSQRIARSFRAVASLTYQLATGKSNSAAEASRQIKQQGFVGANKEQYLIWDTPIDAKLTIIFTPDSSWRIGKFKLKGYRVFLSSIFKSNNNRYTPQIITARTDIQRINNPNDFRNIYEDSPVLRNTELSEALFWADLKISRDFMLAKKLSMSVSIEFKNIFNNVNSQIVNPVTGRAYQDGDQLPISDRDPYYQNPQDNGIMPFDPSRFRQPRQMLLGISFNI